MTEYKRRIFRTLDNPSRMLFWTLDEFFIMMIPIFLSIALGNLLIALGVLIKIPYNKMKRQFSTSLLHYAYWYLPTKHMRYLKRMPPSHQRELIL